MLDAAREGKITLFSGYALLGELEEVLCRRKFSDRLIAAGTTAGELTLGYASLVEIVDPAELAPIVVDDPDDDAVLACAVIATIRMSGSALARSVVMEAFMDDLSTDSSHQIQYGKMLPKCGKNRGGDRTAGFTNNSIYIYPSQWRVIIYLRHSERYA